MEVNRVNFTDFAKICRVQPLISPPLLKCSAMHRDGTTHDVATDKEGKMAKRIRTASSAFLNHFQILVKQ